MISGPWGTLDSTCPIEWSHPTNVQLFNEWAVPPLEGWRGSNVLRDLARGGRNPIDLTLQAAPTWQGSSFPGSYGGIKYNGSTQFCSAAAVPTNATPLSMWAVYQINASVNSGVLCLGASGSTARYEIQQLKGASQGARAQQNDGTTTGNATVLTAPNTNKWVLAVAVFQTSGIRAVFQVVLDDVAADSLILTANDLTSVPNSMTGVNQTAIGCQHVSTDSSFHSGPIDSCGVYVGRRLQRDDVQALATELMQGNPNRWRWIKNTTYSFPALAAAAAYVPYDIQHSPQHQTIMSL